MCEAAFSKEQESMREFAETIRCDLKCVASEALARSGLDDSCTPASFRTGYVWPKSYINSQNQIGSGLVLHCMIRAVCGSTRPSVKVEKLVAGFVEFCQNRARWFLHTGLLLDQIRMAKTWPDHPDWIWAGFEKKYKPDLLWESRTDSDAGSRIQAYATWTDSACMLDFLVPDWIRYVYWETTHDMGNEWYYRCVLLEWILNPTFIHLPRSLKSACRII